MRLEEAYGEDRSEWPIAGFSVEMEIPPGTNRRELADFMGRVLAASLADQDVRYVSVEPEKD